MTNESRSDFKTWANKLPKNAIDIWREAMVNIRQLHADVWNGVRLFLAVNGVIIAGGFTITRGGEPSPTTGLILIVLAVLGFAFTIVTLLIFKSQRESFVEMMVQKTLLDKELGFYETTIDGVDLSFPWKVPKKYVPDLQSDPSKWKKEQRWRKASISRLLLFVFLAMLVIYTVALILLLIGFKCGYFSSGHSA